MISIAIMSVKRISVSGKVTANQRLLLLPTESNIISYPISKPVEINN